MARRLIAIDASAASQPPAGSDRYAVSLIRALARVDDDHDYVVYTCSFNIEQLTGLGERFRVIEAGPWAPGGRRLWHHAGLPLELLRRHAGLLHSPDQETPRLVRCARVVTVHDMGPVLLPSQYSSKERHTLQAAVKRAHAIITPSTSVAADLTQAMGTPPERVHVTPTGVDTSFRAMDPEQCTQQALDLYGLPPGYMLCLGYAPRRDRSHIYRAVRRLLDSERDVDLAVVGDEPTERDTEVIKELSIEDSVHFCPQVAQQDLPAIYNAASLLLHPSHYDGLALSVLEGMACGTPTIVSDRATPAEVAGEAALVVDSADADAIAAAAARLLDDPTFATNLRFEGFKRASAYSWEACAEATVKVYRQALKED